MVISGFQGDLNLETETVNPMRDSPSIAVIRNGLT